MICSQIEEQSKDLPSTVDVEVVYKKPLSDDSVSTTFALDKHTIAKELLHMAAQTFGVQVIALLNFINKLLFMLVKQVVDILLIIN